MEAPKEAQSLLANHLIAAPTHVNLENEEIEFEPETEEEKTNKYIDCVRGIQGIFAKGYSKQNGDDLINYLQKQRSLILELMLENFMRRADAKMGDAINTLMSQMEKSVRDDRKEAMKAKEMETSKETFALFAKSLSAVTDGTLVIPNFGPSSLLLDPMKPLVDANKEKIKPEELQMGNILVDDKKIEQEIAQEQQAHQGNELTTEPDKK